jgi:uncharacterized protein YdiU (UPF0061 family)
MDATNPSFVLRNHVAQSAIEAYVVKVCMLALQAHDGCIVQCREG